jgi:hypothetical protein
MAANKLQSARLFQISNSFYLAYYKVDDDLRNSDVHTAKQTRQLEAQAKQLKDAADSFGQWANEGMALEVSLSVTRLSETIQKAANVLHNIQLVGKALDVVADLVLIGGTLAKAAADPVALARLPEQVDLLIAHLKVP